MSLTYSPRTASSVVTRFLAADSAAAARSGFNLKFFARAINDGTVLVDPKKNLNGNSAGRFYANKNISLDK